MNLSYSLDGTGWATASFQDGDSEVALTASYLHDSLGDLAQSAIDLRKGESTSTVVFMDEPGEHHLVLSQNRDGVLVLELRWFDDWASWGMYPADQFDVVYTAQTTVDEFIAVVFRTLEQVLAEWGLEGYKKKWIEHPFPKKVFRKLSDIP
ncbi:MAG: hypothetical protein AAF593_08345 [Planctomycetota bacterium]